MKEMLLALVDNIKYDLKITISNVSLDHYTDAIYSLLDISNSLNELEEAILSME